jgi:hypothetical protein
MGTQPVLMRAPAHEGTRWSAGPARAASRRLRPGERALAMPTRTAAPRSVAAIPVFAASERDAALFAPPAIPMQRKLAIGAVDDPLEDAIRRDVPTVSCQNAANNISRREMFLIVSRK